MKSKPRHWFFRTIGEILSLTPVAVELLPILTEPDRSDWPRTMLKSHDVVEEEDEDDEEDEEDDDKVDKEEEEESERFISKALIPRHNSRIYFLGSDFKDVSCL